MGTRLSGESGFTLVEVVMSALILVVVLIPLVQIINRGVLLSQQAQEKTIAMGLATDYLEQVLSTAHLTVSDFDKTHYTIDKYTQVNRKKSFTRWVVVSTKETKYSKNRAYQFNDLLVTVTVHWIDNWSGQDRHVDLTTELLGR